jgi:CPA1 family monovalent cation:H+ antiporter
MGFRHTMFWGGLRGAISVALALSLVGEVERLGEEVVATLQVMTFGVVLFTLLAQGLTIERLIRRLGLASRPAERLEQQRRQARIYARRAGISELRRLREQGALPGDLFAAMLDLYEMEADRERDALRQHLRRYPELETDMYLRARVDTLRAEQRALHDAARIGLVEEEVLAELIAVVNEHLAALEFIEGNVRQGDVVPAPDDDGGSNG